MHPTKTLRRITAVLMVAVVVLAGIALPASAAKGGNGHGRGHTTSQPAKTKSQTRGKSQNSKQHGKNKIRVQKFAASGVVESVTADTLTVVVHGRHRRTEGGTDTETSTDVVTAV